MTLSQSRSLVRKRSVVIALLVAGALLLAAWESGGGHLLGGRRAMNAAAAPPRVTLFVKVVGKKQGTFKPDVTAKGHADMMLASAFDYGLVSPRDPATGQGTGRRQHRPVVITKEWGPSMPQFLQAAATSEILTKVTMEFWDTDKTGAQRLHFVVTLTDAGVSEVRQRLANDLLTEDLSFTFRKIQVEDKIGKTIFVDDLVG